MRQLSASTWKTATGITIVFAIASAVPQSAFATRRVTDRRVANHGPKERERRGEWDRRYGQERRSALVKPFEGTDRRENPPTPPIRRVHHDLARVSLVLASDHRSQADGNAGERARAASENLRQLVQHLETSGKDKTAYLDKYAQELWYFSPSRRLSDSWVNWLSPHLSEAEFTRGVEAALGDPKFKEIAFKALKSKFDKMQRDSSPDSLAGFE